MGHKILLTIVATLLAACGGNEMPASSTPPAQDNAAPAARTATPASPATQPAASQTAAPTAAAPSAAAAQPGADTAVPSAAAQPSAERPPAVQRRFSEGTHYARLTPQQPTVATDDGRVEVVEIFQYSCPACFNFEPYLNQWKETKADYINFVRIPTPWNALSELHARAYYTAETLGVLDEIHTPFFREFHVNGNYLQNEAQLADFFGRFGVDEETFMSTFNSFAVHTKLQRARDLVQRYRVSATPEIVVAGKYRTGGQMAGSYEAWFDIINELAAVEYAAN